MAQLGIHIHQRTRTALTMERDLHDETAFFSLFFQRIWILVAICPPSRFGGANGDGPGINPDATDGFGAG